MTLFIASLLGILLLYLPPTRQANMTDITIHEVNRVKWDRQESCSVLVVDAKDGIHRIALFPNRQEPSEDDDAKRTDTKR